MPGNDTDLTSASTEVGSQLEYGCRPQTYAVPKFTSHWVDSGRVGTDVDRVAKSPLYRDLVRLTRGMSLTQ